MRFIKDYVFVVGLISTLAVALIIFNEFQLPHYFDSFSYAIKED